MTPDPLESLLSMKVVLKKEKVSSVFHDGKFYDTGKELDLNFSEAYRLSRVASLAVNYESVPYNPRLWKDSKFINFNGDIDQQSGFGNVSYYLIKESTGELQIATMGKTYGVRDQTIINSQNRELNQAGAMVWHDQPREAWLYSPFKKNIAIIPWETTLIPKSWVSRINLFDALLVPCKQNIEAFHNSGVKVPIELIHWGLDPLRFYRLDRPEREVFTFGHMGALSFRKGTDLLIEAFQQAFPNEKDVKLICKTSFNTYPFNTKDPRIKVMMTPFSPEELISEFFKQIDCFVFPTRGEGWGMTPMEAMATGIPAIVTGWAGPMEYMSPEDGWLLDYKLTPATNFSEKVYHEDCGEWAEPNKDQLIEFMRYAYSHRAEVKEKGAKAAARMSKEFLWKDKVKMFHSALNKFL